MGNDRAFRTQRPVAPWLIGWLSWNWQAPLIRWAAISASTCDAADRLRVPRLDVFRAPLAGVDWPALILADHTRPSATCQRRRAASFSQSSRCRATDLTSPMSLRETRLEHCPRGCPGQVARMVRQTELGLRLVSGALVFVAPARGTPVRVGENDRGHGSGRARPPGACFARA